MKNFSDLTEQEMLALAIALEEEDSRTYSDLADAMRESYPGTARMFAAMAVEEDGHRHRLLDLYREKFGDHIPLIRRQDVKGFLERKSLWLARPLRLDKVRAQVELMEGDSSPFLIPNFRVAVRGVGVVVFIELVLISLDKTPVHGDPRVVRCFASWVRR